MVSDAEIHVPECIASVGLVFLPCTVQIGDYRNGDCVHPGPAQPKDEGRSSAHQRSFKLDTPVDQAQRESSVPFVQVAVTCGDIHH